MIDHDKVSSLSHLPLISELQSLKETIWFNKDIITSEEALLDVPLTQEDVTQASYRLTRFADYIKEAFPETTTTNGIIESELVDIENMKLALEEHYRIEVPGKFYLKKDSHLPISGSIKARGGIYEVLKHAETLAIQHGMLKLTDNYNKINDQSFKSFFKNYKIAVGSTGNLGLSIGIISATIGF